MSNRSALAHLRWPVLAHELDHVRRVDPGIEPARASGHASPTVAAYVFLGPDARIGEMTVLMFGTSPGPTRSRQSNLLWAMGAALWL